MTSDPSRKMVFPAGAALQRARLSARQGARMAAAAVSTGMPRRGDFHACATGPAGARFLVMVDGRPLIAVEAGTGGGEMRRSRFRHGAIDRTSRPGESGVEVPA